MERGREGEGGREKEGERGRERETIGDLASISDARLWLRRASFQICGATLPQRAGGGGCVDDASSRGLHAVWCAGPV